MWDVDILLHYEQVLEAISLIRRNKTKFVLPYDGRVFKIDPVLKRLYMKQRFLNIISQNQKKMLLMYGHFSQGGVFFVKRSTYQRNTMENENFYGWGPEDLERVKRWEILGYNVERINGPLFHLNHPRGKNSWYGSKDIEKKNRLEFIRICRMNKIELLDYFNKQAKEKSNI
jgi:predicted glycosyltransferase involved in capsule biosynthesis